MKGKDKAPNTETSPASLSTSTLATRSIWRCSESSWLVRSRPLTSSCSRRLMMPTVASWTRPRLLLESITVTPVGPMAMWSMFARPRPGTRRSCIRTTSLRCRRHSSARAVAASPSAPWRQASTFRGSPASAATSEPTGPYLARTRWRRACWRRAYSRWALAPGALSELSWIWLMTVVIDGSSGSGGSRRLPGACSLGYWRPVWRPCGRQRLLGVHRNLAAGAWAGRVDPLRLRLRQVNRQDARADGLAGDRRVDHGFASVERAERVRGDAELAHASGAAAPRMRVSVRTRLAGHLP